MQMSQAGVQDGYVIGAPNFESGTDTNRPPGGDGGGEAGARGGR